MMLTKQVIIRYYFISLNANTNPYSPLFPICSY